jgi:ATP-binding cassette, subfamily B, bacterial MsbA
MSETKPSAAPATSPAPNSEPLLQRIRRVKPYYKGTGRGFVAVLLAATVAAVTEPMLPWLVQQLLDRGFGPDRGYPLALVPVVIIGLFVVRGIATFVSAYALSWIGNRALSNLRSKMFTRLMNAAPDLFGQQSASALTNTIVYESQQGSGNITWSLMVLVRDSLMVMAFVAYLLWLNWKLTFAVLLVAPAVALVMRSVSRRIRRLTQEGQAVTDELAYVVEENVQSWKIVRVHEAQQAQTGRFERHSERLRRVLVKTGAANGMTSPLTQIVSSLALSGVVVVALWQGTQGQSTMGEFVAFVTAMLMLVSPLKHLSDVTGPLARGLTQLERGMDLVDMQRSEASGTHRIDKARGEIVFDDVALRYSEQEGRDALAGLSLRIAAGTVVALVGPSGGGKTSLVNLLPRFIEPTRGRVTLDGVTLPEWDLSCLRRQFAIVSQDVLFFDDTVAANVALGSDVDEARVRKALADANLLEHVQRMPQGIHSEVGHNASQLSGGQRQRLAIARAIYKDSPVLILDEATSALDSQSERAVQEALEHLLRGRTTIVIAHRLATVEHADLVVVMDQGRIVEQGPPAALKARGGLYAQLHAMQFR